MKKAVVLYWSRTGTTEMVARCIEEGLRGAESVLTLRTTFLESLRGSFHQLKSDNFTSGNVH